MHILDVFICYQIKMSRGMAWLAEGIATAKPTDNAGHLRSAPSHLYLEKCVSC